MPTAKFSKGMIVFVDDTPTWIGKIISMRLRMEDERYVYVVKDEADSEHIQTLMEHMLSEVETLESPIAPIIKEPEIF